MENNTNTQPPTHCDKCHHALPVLPPGHTGGTGYAHKEEDGKTTYICYQCCAEEEKTYMRAHGKVTLYLAWDQENGGKEVNHRVTNWPGTLTFTPFCVHKGKHNIGRIRHDVWFMFEGSVWHGVCIGENTQLLHCRKTKQSRAS